MRYGRNPLFSQHPEEGAFILSFCMVTIYKERMKKMKKMMRLVSVAALLLMCLLGVTACGQQQLPEYEQPSQEADADLGLWKDAAYISDTELGEGATTVTVLVKADERQVTFTIHTDKTTVGEALQEHNLLEGEESEYGLYAKEVNGIVADYDVDQYYWAFYINGEYAMSGVDTTNIEEGVTYCLERTK